MKRKWFYAMVGGACAVLVPVLAWASGEAAGDLVVVADTRHLSGFGLYLANLYNENIWMFAVCSVVFTTALGATLGLLMDVIMARTGGSVNKFFDVGRRRDLGVRSGARCEPKNKKEG